MKASGRHLLLLSNLLLIATAQQCFFPNGDKSRDIPCSTTEISSCCGKGFACLSNGLCMHTSNIAGVPEPAGSWYGRGSCSDPTWKSDNCPKFCVTPGTDPLGNGVGVNKCDTEGENEQYYWCGNNATKGMDSQKACSNKEFFFTIKGADPTTVTIAGIPGVTLNPSAVTTTPPNSTTATTSSTSPAATNENPPNSPPSKDYSVAIGAGVGVPLGVIAITLIGYLFWRSRRNQVRPYNQALPPYQAADSYNEWMVMRNQPSPSVPSELPKDALYQYKQQTGVSGMGERRNSVHQLPAAEHFDPQELSTGHPL